MAKFKSAKELDRYIKLYTTVRSPHKAILIHPQDQALFEAPADQVQHYLDKGFRWSKR